MAASEFAISMSQPNLLAGNFPERGYNLAIASLQQALCPVKKLFRPFSCEYYEAEAIGTWCRQSSTVTRALTLLFY
jgi:hypothetical protein